MFTAAADDTGSGVGPMVKYWRSSGSSWRKHGVRWSSQGFLQSVTFPPTRPSEPIMVAIGAIGWQLWEMPPTRCLLPIQVLGARCQVPPSNPGARCHLPGVPPSRCHLVAGAEQRHILAVKKMVSLWRDHSVNIFEVHADHHSCRLFEAFRANKGGTLWVP